MERIVRFFVERHLLVNVITIAVVVMGFVTARQTNISTGVCTALFTTIYSRLGENDVRSKG